jgi:adenine-specific DNA-methyltransferase
MPRGRPKGSTTKPKAKATPELIPDSYEHPESSLPLRPEAGTQAQFKKAKPATTYRYDSSLSPSLEWDGQNRSRERGEQRLAEIAEQTARLRAATDETTRRDAIEKIEAAVAELKALGKPFLNWAGKAERLSFDVPTLPLFVHERLSTEAIIETLRTHKKDKQTSFADLFADPEHPVADQILKAYEHRDKWVNRMILGDALVAMNSLLRYESLGGQVQMIYMDPPYGVKFGSNFQPFVRKRDVKHNDDDDFTREPETVKAYRDTWELGLHSYLTYLRDRLLVCRELLAPTGSIFVQISDENLHHVRELMDEVFGANNYISIITFKKTTSSTGDKLGTVSDYLLWYAKQSDKCFYTDIYIRKEWGGEGTTQYIWVEDGKVNRKLSEDELLSPSTIPKGSRIFAADNCTSSRSASENEVKEIHALGQTFKLTKGSFKTHSEGFKLLEDNNRLIRIGNSLMYKRYYSDFPFIESNNIWTDTIMTGFSEAKIYAVQTSLKVIQKCLLLTTKPGDLVLDPTCGSGTTAYVAEKWGRRWITCDISRVPLALARQRLLTATFPWYDLKDDKRGPAGGFRYERRQNNNGEEVGGIVPHIMLESIANNEPPDEEVLVDRPEVKKGVTRVTGPFVVEGTIPVAVSVGEETEIVTGSGGIAPHPYPSPPRGEGNVDRMVEVLKKSPVLRLDGNKTVTFKNVRRPAKSLSLSAEALVVNGEDKPVAFYFGPENGAVSERAVFEAAREANGKRFTHLYVIGFAVDPNARKLIQECEEVCDIPATYVQATPDLLMGDLLKNTRSSQIFSVCGLPDVAVRKAKPKKGETAVTYEVELLGLDVVDPSTMESEPRKGNDVPAWFLDGNYNGRVFKVSQAFFPRTAAWDNLKKALKATHDEAVWDHLAGTVSAPFEAGNHNQIAVKVIDDRGNELIVVKALAGVAS